MYLIIIVDFLKSAVEYSTNKRTTNKYVNRFIMYLFITKNNDYVYYIGTVIKSLFGSLMRGEK